MNEFRISLVGRARTGKSLFLTRFVNEPNEIVVLSNSGADSTKVPTELILRSDTTETTIECHYKDTAEYHNRDTEIKKERILIDDLKEFHEKIRKDSALQERISHIEIKAKPAEWVSKVLKKSNTTQLTVIDTEGVSGAVKELNIRNWKVNLFVLLINSTNMSEFTESINKMKHALFGNNIWYAVSLGYTTLPLLESELSTEINELEDEARKIKEEFSDELNKLEDEKSLLNMKSLDVKRKDTVLAIPNIKLKPQYKSGREYTDKKLEEFLTIALKNENEEIDVIIDPQDKIKNESASKLLQSLCNIAMHVLKNKNEIGIPLHNKQALFRHLKDEFRLISKDRGYLVNFQWNITSNIRFAVYRKINEIKFDENSSLSEKDQAALVQKFYNNFVNKMIWTNYFVATKDGRENTEQASIILMLHALEIKNQFNSPTPVTEVIQNITLRDSGWYKSYLVDTNKESEKYFSIYYAAKQQEAFEKSEEYGFERFYDTVIIPCTMYAIHSTSLQLGYKTFEDFLNEA